MSWTTLSILLRLTMRRVSKANIKYPFKQLLHSFEVHYPIRFPRFTTVG
jgi:hypothetical protein